MPTPNQSLKSLQSIYIYFQQTYLEDKYILCSIQITKLIVKYIHAWRIPMLSYNLTFENISLVTHKKTALFFQNKKKICIPQLLFTFALLYLLTYIQI